MRCDCIVGQAEGVDEAWLVRRSDFERDLWSLEDAGLFKFCPECGRKISAKYARALCRYRKGAFKYGKKLDVPAEGLNLLMAQESNRLIPEMVNCLARPNPFFSLLNDQGTV